VIPEPFVGARRPSTGEFRPSLGYCCLVRFVTCAALSLVLGLVVGCEPEATSSGGGDAGGGSGGCLSVPQPTFALAVLEKQGGPVPPDTTVQIHWSGGDEPPFHLDDPSSWPTLQTASFTCDVDPGAPPPVDLPVLTCALWTSSPTEVSVAAQGFVAQAGTYTADPTSDCNPAPTPIAIELVAAPR
jgi:hypothetical protein